MHTLHLFTNLARLYDKYICIYILLYYHLFLDSILMSTKIQAEKTWTSLYGSMWVLLWDIQGSQHTIQELFFWTVIVTTKKASKGGGRANVRVREGVLSEICRWTLATLHLCKGTVLQPFLNRLIIAWLERCTTNMIVAYYCIPLFRSPNLSIIQIWLYEATLLGRWCHWSTSWFCMI